MNKMKLIVLGMVLVFGVLVVSGVMVVMMLENVKEKGYLQCGVISGLFGFFQLDEKGNWMGIDVDICCVVVVVIFGDVKVVEFILLIVKECFIVLQFGEIDMFFCNIIWIFICDVLLGLNFVGVNYYDGQGFLINKDIGVDDVIQLDGVIVCIQVGIIIELNLFDYFCVKGMEFKLIVFDILE